MSKRTRSRTGVQAKRKRARHDRRIRLRGEKFADLVLLGMSRSGNPVPPYWPGERNVGAEQRWAKRVGGRPRFGRGRRRLRGCQLRLCPAGMDGAAFFDTDRHPLGSAGTYSNLLAPPARWGDIKAAILEAAERFATLWPERPMRREYGNRDWSRVFLAPIAPPEPPPIAVADVAHRLTGFRYDIEAWAPRLYSWPPRVYLDADPEPSRPRRYKASALRTWLRRERRREWAEGAARIVTTEDWNRYNRAHRRIEEGLVPLGPLDTYNGVKVSALCIECRNKIAWVEHNFEASAALCAPCSDLIAKAVVG